jgi:hypothetical protein
MPPKRKLQEHDPNVTSSPPKKSSKTETATPKQNEPNYGSLTKTELGKMCAALGLYKTGSMSDLISRLQSADQARKAKYAYSKNAPYSKEDVAKWPIGAKVAPSKSRTSSGKNSAVERILRRGPTGRPVHDAMGFEIDYHKVAGVRSRRGPGCRTMNSKKYLEMFERERLKEERKREIMGTHKDKVSALTLMAWDDRISRDLGIPFHLVDMEDFEEWHRRGFKADGAEFEAKNMSEEERDRLSDLTTGASFRK